MKKLFILPIALLVLSLTSCKKDYTCTCTMTGATSAQIITIVDATKSAAQANCVSYTETYSGSTTDVVTCELSK